MTDLYQNKYRIASARLQNWNYNQEAMYFVTICTKNKENYFGKIINEKMKLSEMGKIAHSEWFRSLEMRSDMNIELGEFVVMPNHIHGIVIIGENEYNTPPAGIIVNRRDATHCVSTVNNNPNEPYQNQFEPHRASSYVVSQKTCHPSSADINLR